MQSLTILTVHNVISLPANRAQRTLVAVMPQVSSFIEKKMCGGILHVSNDVSNVVGNQTGLEYDAILPAPKV